MVYWTLYLLSARILLNKRLTNAREIIKTILISRYSISPILISSVGSVGSVANDIQHKLCWLYVHQMLGQHQQQGLGSQLSGWR